MLADRAGFHAKSEHKVTVERIDNARMIELASRLAAELGVPMERIVGSNAPPMIEHDVVEVRNEQAGEVGTGVESGDGHSASAISDHAGRPHIQGDASG